MPTPVNVEDLKAEVLANEGDGITVLAKWLGHLPIYELDGDIADYENQSGSNELVWFGGTAQSPNCIWLVYPDDSRIKLKEPLPGDETFCETVYTCIAADLARGAGVPDCYHIPEMDGPTWRVVSVEWGDDGDADIDFSASVGTDLVSLVAALNGSGNLPEGWSWDIVLDTLVLCVPHGVEIIEVVLEGGEAATFNGVPTTTGSAASSLGDKIEIIQVVYGSGALVASDDTDEAAIEAQFSLASAVTVHWIDTDGEDRISYKTSHGWHHPREKRIASLLIASQADRPDIIMPATSLPIGGTYNVSSFPEIPDDASKLLVHMATSASNPSSGVDIVATVNSRASNYEFPTGSDANTYKWSEYFEVPVNRSTGAFQASLTTTTGVATQIQSSIVVIGYSVK